MPAWRRSLRNVAFAAIVLIVDTSGRPRDGEITDIGISVFVAAFFSLIVAAFLYGTAAGEELIASRAALMTLVSGFALGIGVMDLFAGIVWLIDARSGAGVSNVIARVVATTLPTLSLYYLTYTISNVDRLSSHTSATGSRLDIRLLLGALLILVILLVAFQLLWDSPILRPSLEWAAARRTNVITWVTVSSTGLSVVMAMIAGVFLQQGPRFTLPSWIFDISAPGLLAGEVLFAWFVRVLVQAHGVDRPSASQRRPSRKPLGHAP